jgi:small-conductance mechanosensitive channel
MQHLLTTVESWVQATLGISPAAFERLLWSLGILLLFFLTRLVIAHIVHNRVSDIARRYVIQKTFSYILGFAFILIATIVWFGNITGWSAYLGIVSAGLAIALQDPVTNFAGWIFITIRKPFVVGDRVEIGGHRGDVIDLRLFQFTLVEVGNWVDADQSTGRIIHIPNGWIFKQSTANYTMGFDFIWNELPITITFESDWQEAKRILTEIAARHKLLEDEKTRRQVQMASRKYMIHFQHLSPSVWTSVADSGVTLTLRYICEPRTRRISEGVIWEEVLRAFAEVDNVDFAYPTTRFYDNVSEGKAGARATLPTP